jgi:hypothetical protein
MKKVYLHKSEHFKDLIDITAGAMNIQDPTLVEKDYWIMHVLWGLQNLNLSFHLKGGQKTTPFLKKSIHVARVSISKGAQP